MIAIDKDKIYSFQYLIKCFSIVGNQNLDEKQKNDLFSSIFDKMLERISLYYRYSGTEIFLHRKYYNDKADIKNANKEFIMKDILKKEFGMEINGDVLEEYGLLMQVSIIHRLLIKYGAEKNLLEKLLQFITNKYPKLTPKELIPMTFQQNDFENRIASLSLFDYLEAILFTCFEENTIEEDIAISMIKNIVDKIIKNSDKFTGKFEQSDYYFSGNFAKIIFEISLKNNFAMTIVDLISKDMKMISGKTTYDLFDILDKEEKINTTEKRLLLSKMLNIFQYKLKDGTSRFSPERLIYIFELLAKYKVDAHEILNLKNTILSSNLMPEQTKQKIEKRVKY